MRKITVEDNKIVVEVGGAKVRYSIDVIKKRINTLLDDLEEWRRYERLLTQRPPDVGVCTCENVTDAHRGTWLVCGVCLKPRRR